MKSFKQFLEELPGDKNFSAYDSYVSFRNSNEKSFNYSYAELYECLQKIYLSGEKLFENLRKFADNEIDPWPYKEDTYRLALVGGKYEINEDGEKKMVEFNEPIFSKNLNAVTTNLGSQTLNTVRILQLYACYLVGSSPTADHKYPIILDAKNLEGFFSFSELPFKNYLKGKVVENSASKYIQAIKGTLSRVAGKALFRKADKSDITSDLNRILDNEYYKKLNDDGNGMYGAAVNHYKKFLETNIDAKTNLDDVVASLQSLCALTKEYNLSNETWRTNDPKAQEGKTYLKIIQNWAKATFGSFRGYEFDIKIGDGKGIFPKMPWVALCPVGQTVKDGVNIGLNFDKKGTGIVCGFGGSPSAVPPVTVAPIDENASMEVHPKNYGYVNPKEFPMVGFEISSLQDHIIKSLDLCLDYLQLTPTAMFNSEYKKQVADSIKLTGFQAADGLIERLLLSLSVKPFVILTGNSGTGKTKLAELLSAYLAEEGCRATVAVGAGWTDNRNVLGFVNYLRTSETLSEDSTKIQLPLYQTTPVLDLLLKASNDQGMPYFLILDEMNLSHVERYFSDFLSAIESRNGELRLHSEGDQETLLPSSSGGDGKVPQRLPLPKNVFVIGTVNVDETTYMFSPKVLDRANVIEFSIGTTQLKNYFEDKVSRVSDVNTSDKDIRRAFLQLSKKTMGGELATYGTEDDRQEIEKAIMEVFAIMADANLEFGFRTVNEIQRYLAVDYALCSKQSDWKWQSALDIQMLQKILPKLHGSKRRIELLLLRLAEFCQTGTTRNPDAELPENLRSSPVVKVPSIFGSSHEKLMKMIDAVRRDQFVSFIH